MKDGGQGFSLEYPAVSLHAVSRDPTAFPQENLYLMVDANLDRECNEYSPVGAVCTVT